MGLLAKRSDGGAAAGRAVGANLDQLQPRPPAVDKARAAAGGAKLVAHHKANLPVPSEARLNVRHAHDRVVQADAAAALLHPGGGARRGGEHHHADGLRVGRRRGVPAGRPGAAAPTTTNGIPAARIAVTAAAAVTAGGRLPCQSAVLAGGDRPRRPQQPAHIPAGQRRHRPAAARGDVCSGPTAVKPRSE